MSYFFGFLFEMFHLCSYGLVVLKRTTETETAAPPPPRENPRPPQVYCFLCVFVCMFKIVPRGQIFYFFIFISGILLVLQ